MKTKVKVSSPINIPECNIIKGKKYDAFIIDKCSSESWVTTVEIPELDIRCALTNEYLETLPSYIKCSWLNDKALWELEY